MFRLSLAALTALVLSACSTTVTPAVPHLSNLRTQSTYCSTGDTELDLKFTPGYEYLLSEVTSLEIYIVEDGSRPGQGSPHDTVSQGLFTDAASRYWVSILSDSDGDGLVSVAGVPRRVQRSRLAPATPRRVWLRAENRRVYGPFVEARNALRPDADAATCDPAGNSVY